MSIYSTGVTALQAAQASIATTGHNIANVNTDGYRRQEVVLATNTAVKTGSGYIGQGVNVTTVRRVYSEFLERQVIQSESRAAYLDQYQTAIQQIDSVLGDRSAGFAGAIQKFFAAWQNLSGNPASGPARQGVLGAANVVANSINSMGDYLQSLQESVNREISSLVAQVNSYASNIADMNTRIAAIQNSQLQPPNDLLDQRDQLVSQLNELVGVTVVKDATTGDYNLFMGRGFQLVVGGESNAISASSSQYDPLRTEVYAAGDVVQISGKSVIAGRLGALLDYREETLDVTQNELGRIAIAMTESVNALHASGVDLNGGTGNNFFASLTASPLALASTNNAGTAVLTATINNAGQLTASDYSLTFDGATFTLTRQSDGQSWSDPDVAVLSGLAAQGFALSISVAPNAGDSFLIRPTVVAANNASVAISDTALIAAASGTALPGDTLDNQTALAITALQRDITLIAGNNTLESSYTSLVHRVGSKAEEVETNLRAQSNLLDQAVQAQQSASGVNLDEEAANLIRYQQAYQAAAQLFKTANNMFDTLLALGG